MRQLITAISLICVFTISDVSAQMKQWTDENGILHFENKSPTVPERLAQQPTAQVNKRLERTYAGFTLGDDASAFRAARRGFSSGADKHGGEIFLFYPKFLPSRATKGTALFIDGRLALMEFVYRDYALDWDSTVKNTASRCRQSFLDGWRNGAGSKKRLLGQHQCFDRRPRRYVKIL